MIPIIQRAKQHGDAIAIVDPYGQYNYDQLVFDARQVANTLLNYNLRLAERPICFLVPPTYDYVKIQWGIWLSGAIAAPMAVNHPLAELEYVLTDTGAPILIYHPMFEKKAQALAQNFSVQLLSSQEIDAQEELQRLPEVSVTQAAMMIYTSGTTGKPKGVVTTHANITAHIEALTEAWHWAAEDRIVNILPLHHVHGIVNVVASALWNGATCYMQPTFDLEALWKLIRIEQLTLFMAVPTIYAKMIADIEEMAIESSRALRTAFRDMRLMVSGSAALPVTVLKKWQEISGHVLLERYGMTEIGMALSNSYTEARIPGHVGKPLPGIRARIVDAHGHVVSEGEAGELEIKGPTVFKEYWQKEHATQEAFTEDGWFKTGDVVQQNEEGIFKILGRQSVDIIKTGGYKVSALEIEEVLRTHETIGECAVVGLPNEEWGQVIAAAIVLKNQSVDIAVIKTWLKEQLAPYKNPIQWKLLNELPKNAMGKVVKPTIVKLFL